MHHKACLDQGINEVETTRSQAVGHKGVLVAMFKSARVVDESNEAESDLEMLFQNLILREYNIQYYYGKKTVRLTRVSGRALA